MIASGAIFQKFTEKSAKFAPILCSKIQIFGKKWPKENSPASRSKIIMIERA